MKPSDAKLARVELDAATQLTEAARAELGDIVLQLDARIGVLRAELGDDFDELDALQRFEVYRSFADAIRQAMSHEKRRALIAVAARRFDARMGPRGFRSQLWRLVASLEDEELSAVVLVADRAVEVREKDGQVYRSKDPAGARVGSRAELRDLRGAAGFAFAAALASLRKREPALAAFDAARELYVLTDVGRLVWGFACEGDPQGTD